MSSIRFLVLMSLILVPLFSEAKRRRVTPVPVVAPTPAPVDCTLAENFMSQVCAARRAALSSPTGPTTIPEAVKITRMGTKNAEGGSSDSKSQSKDNKDEKKKEEKPATSTGAAAESQPNDPNIVYISSGSTVSTAPVPKNTNEDEKKKKIDRKPASYETDDYYVNDGGKSGTIVEASRAQPTQPIAWSAGGKKVEEYDATAEIPQGFTGPGGRSNWEKVRQRYYDNTGSLERPDTMPPSPVPK